MSGATTPHAATTRARARGARLAGVALLLAAGAGAAGTLPERFVAEFVLEAHGATVGRTTWSLAPGGEGRFVYESLTETAGVVALIRDDRIVERSVWRYGDDGGLRPLRYRYERTGKKARDVAIDFDWENGRVHNTAKGRTWELEVPAGTLDKLSYLLAMMRDFRGGARSVTYDIADGGKVKTYRLETRGEETLETALGPLDTVMVERLRDDDDERETLLWVAPALDFLPVKVRHREKDGSVLVLRVESVDGIGPAPAQARRATSDAAAARRTP